MSEFEDKREAALKLLEASGISKANYCPPLLRLLWRLGFKVPPPHFASFVGVAAIVGTFFAVAWGAIMWFTVWRNAGMSLVTAVGNGAGAGALFGLIMSAHYAYGRKKYRLPDWKNLSVTGGA